MFELSVCACLLGLSVVSAASAQTTKPAKQTAEFPLWPGGAPGAKGTDPVKDVPTLTPFWPKEGVKATGAAIVVCPGGGYGGLAQHEGRDYAVWLADHGVTGFVLKYRLGSNGYRHPAMMYDVQHAVRTIRANAAEWQIDGGRIGVMGSSAGGHLTSVAVTHFDAGDANAADPVDRVSCRPDLGILCYPVISMGPLAHVGSKKNLLGENPDPALVHLLSSEEQVTAETPPCFVWHTVEDPGVKVENSLVFATALREHNVPFDLHLYQKGGHGLGLGVHGYDAAKHQVLLPWTNDLLSWLRVQKFVD